MTWAVARNPTMHRALFVICWQFCWRCVSVLPCPPPDGNGKNNLDNLGSLMQDVSLDVTSWQDTDTSLKTKWRFRCVLGLPWKPTLAAAGVSERLKQRFQRKRLFGCNPGMFFLRPAGMHAWSLFFLRCAKYCIDRVLLAATLQKYFERPR